MWMCDIVQTIRVQHFCAFIFLYFVQKINKLQEYSMFKINSICSNVDLQNNNDNKITKKINKILILKIIIL